MMLGLVYNTRDRNINECIFCPNVLEMIGKFELVFDVAPPDAEQRRVDRQDERFEAGCFGASHQSLGDLAVFVDVQLKPLVGGRTSGGHVFD